MTGQRLQEIPAAHLDLTLAKYKGKIVIENPKTSSPGRIFLLTTIALYGEKGYLDYWRKLKPNLLTVAPGWDEAYGMYTNGEVPIVLTQPTRFCRQSCGPALSLRRNYVAVGNITARFWL